MGKIVGMIFKVNMLIIGLLMITYMANSQQLPVFSTFSVTDAYRNPSTLLNPKFDDIQLFYNNSATGFGDAPTSSFIGYSHPFKTQTYQGPSFSQKHNYSNLIKNAVGGYFVYDRYGAMQQISIMAGYAQSFLINDDWSAAMGITAGLYNYKIDFSSLTIKNGQDQTYSRFINQGDNFSFFDANFGTTIRYRNYKIEGSYNQILADKAMLSRSELSTKFYSTLFFAFSTRQTLSKDLQYIPELNFLQTGSLPSWIGLRNQFIYNEIWLGSLIYNHKRNVGVELGFLYQAFMIQYSFLLNTNPFNVVGFTNHNIGLRYSINPRKDTKFEDYY